MRPKQWHRRDVLRTAAIVPFAAAAHLRGSADQAVKWSSGTTPPRLNAPANAVDCHHHIYDTRYPVDPTSTLRPGEATVADYRAFQRRIGTSRNVVVQPSTYGIDNRCTLDATAAFGSTARAVVVVNDTVSRAELERMHGLGARGVRFNLSQAGATTVEMLEPVAKRVNDLGWHVQINAPPATIMEMMPILRRLASPIVFDHLAHIPPGGGVTHPLFDAVRSLIDKGRTWVKLSGAYEDAVAGPPYGGSSAIARAYAKAAPERCVWGSDWPHPTEQQRTPLPDDAAIFDLLLDWAPDEQARHRVLVTNPAALYDFP